MLNHKTSSTAQACGAQVAGEAATQPQHQQIKLAMDVHAASVVVVRMMDGAKPPPLLDKLFLNVLCLLSSHSGVCAT